MVISCTPYPPNKFGGPERTQSNSSFFSVFWTNGLRLMPSSVAFTLQVNGVLILSLSKTWYNFLFLSIKSTYMVSIIPGKEIRRKLSVQGIRIEDVARAFNLHQSTVSRYFSDKLKMTPEFLFNLSDFSGIPIDEFIVRDSNYRKSTEPVDKSSMDIYRQDTVQLIKNMVDKIGQLELAYTLLENSVKRLEKKCNLYQGPR